MLPTDGCRVLARRVKPGEKANRIRSARHTVWSARYSVTGDPGTIAGSATAARENARAIRDALSGDVYEALNSVHLRLSAATASGGTGESGVLLNGVPERLAVGRSVGLDQSAR